MKTNGKGVDAGLLVLRLGIGIAFVVHGWPKIQGGAETWTQLGGAMSVFGITFAPAFWGFMASFAEFVGGLLLVLGLLVRPASVFLLVTMIVATAMQLDQGKDFTAYSHALKMAVVFLALLVAGGGRYGLDRWICGRRCAAPAAETPSEAGSATEGGDDDAA